MPNATHILTDFVLDKLPQEPVTKRIAVTRALAGVTANKELRADLLSIANLLEDIERNHLQLTLDFKRRNA